MAENEYSVPRRGRPRTFAPDDAIDKAMNSFWAGGYEATGMADVLTAMGIGRQSAYNAFGSKRGLFLAALDRYGSTRMAGLVDVLDDPHAGLDEAQVVLMRWASAGALAPDIGCMLINTLAEFGSTDTEVADRTRAQIEHVREMLRHALERAAEDGDIPAQSGPGDLALLLVAVAIGLNLLGRAGIPVEKLSGAIEALTAVLAQPTLVQPHKELQTP
jgi:TetR/AcrR family transcriptional repressor of nem operon